VPPQERVYIRRRRHALDRRLDPPPPLGRGSVRPRHAAVRRYLL